MFITQVYKYRKDNIVYVGGELPIDAEVLETMDILNAEDGYELIRKSDGENVGTSIWMKDGDVQDNYIEVKDESPKPEELEEDLFKPSN